MGVTQVGAQLMLNHMCGNALPVVASSAPTWFPGLYWIDSGNSYEIKEWNGSAWVVSTGERYLALLWGDPTSAVNVSDLDEIDTPGYSRVDVELAMASGAYPSIVTNTGLVSFGPMTDDMTQTAQWAAMVTSASGTGGQYLWWWPIEPQMVSASEFIQCATSELQLDQS